MIRKIYFVKNVFPVWHEVGFKEVGSDWDVIFSLDGDRIYPKKFQEYLIYSNLDKFKVDLKISSFNSVEREILETIIIRNSKGIQYLKESKWLQEKIYKDFFVTDNNWLLDFKNLTAVKLKNKIKNYKVLKKIDIIRDYWLTQNEKKRIDIQYYDTGHFEWETVSYKNLVENSNEGHINLQKMRETTGLNYRIIDYKSKEVLIEF